MPKVIFKIEAPVLVQQVGAQKTQPHRQATQEPCQELTANEPLSGPIVPLAVSPRNTPTGGPELPQWGGVKLSCFQGRPRRTLDDT